MDSLLLPIQVVGMTPKKDKSWKITVETRELTGEEASILVDNFQNEGWMQFSPNQEMPAPPNEPADAGLKSPSERLRGHIYALYQQRGAHGSFNNFYATYIERLCDGIKEKLDE